MLRAFNFDGKFCEWVHTILVSAKLSFSVNGKSVGFFSSQRGVHQGDPLAPILFCLVEDEFSWDTPKKLEYQDIKNGWFP